MTLSRGGAHQNGRDESSGTDENGANERDDPSPRSRVANLGDESQLTDDQVFWVLSNRRRRDILQYLREHGGTASLGELAEYIAAKENEKSVQQLSSDERKRVYVGLYQNHLPMMDDMDVVNYDDDRKTVELRDTVTDLEAYLTGEIEQRDSRLLSIALFATALVVTLGTLRIGIFAAVPKMAWLSVGLISLLGVAVFEWHRGTVFSR